jgi:hypothetical protein
MPGLLGGPEREEQRQPPGCRRSRQRSGAAGGQHQKFRPGGAGRARGAGSGASSITRWTLVPPSPNEEIPARRGPLPCGQSRRSAATKKGEPSKPILGFGRVKFRLGGIVRCFSASAALIIPAAVAPASRGPPSVNM